MVLAGDSQLAIGRALGILLAIILQLVVPDESNLVLPDVEVGPPVRAVVKLVAPTQLPEFGRWQRYAVPRLE